MAISWKGAPFPPGSHADGSAVVSDVSLALPPWRSTDDRVRRATMVGFKAFEATQATLTGLERMHRLKKKPDSPELSGGTHPRWLKAT
jgi:hypothetical protein